MFRPIHLVFSSMSSEQSRYTQTFATIRSATIKPLYDRIGRSHSDVVAAH